MRSREVRIESGMSKSTPGTPSNTQKNKKHHKEKHDFIGHVCKGWIHSNIREIFTTHNRQPTTHKTSPGVVLVVLVVVLVVLGVIVIVIEVVASHYCYYY